MALLRTEPNAARAATRRGDGARRHRRPRRPELVYRDTAAKLFGVCLRILRDTGEAEDVLQDVYMTVWRRAATFDPGRASPITWLVAIARNRSIDRLRSSAKRAGCAARRRLRG